MKFDLKRPCKNCPFKTDKTAIRFSGRERAEEIAESAYRNGFPCHLSAHDTSEDDEDGGYVFAENTQHCAGAMIMFLGNGNGGNVPFQLLSNEEQSKIENQMDYKAPVYEDEDAFLDSYGEEK